MSAQAPSRAYGRPFRRATPLLRRLGGLAGSTALTAPALGLIAVFLVYPLIGVLLRSFDPQGNLSYSHPIFSFANYSFMWSDPAARIILRNTFVIAGIATVATAIIAYPIAFFLTRIPARWTKALLLLTLIGFLTSIIVRVYALELILQKLGLLFTNTATIVGMVAYLLPYLIIIFYGGMAGIDDDLLRAARSLGARPSQVFLRVFLPLSRPAVLAGTLLVFILGLGFFITPALLGPPSGITVSIYIQQQVDQGQWGAASAMGIALLVVALIIYYLFDRILGLDRIAGGGTQVARSGARPRESSRPLLIGLGLWTAAAFALLLLPLVAVVLLSFTEGDQLQLPPHAFSTEWYHALFSDPSWKASAWLSLRIAMLATAIATVTGVCAALVLARRSFPGRGILRAMFLLPLIVPVILIAAAVFDLESRMRIVGSVLGYALGHALLATPFVVIICTTALAELGTTLEEAARSLGANRFHAFRKITLRLILPSVLTAAAIAFVTSWDEPVLSLFLQGLTQTLPVHIFSFVKEEVQPTVAALSSILLGGVLVVALLAGLISRLLRGRRAPGAAVDTTSGPVRQ